MSTLIFLKIFSFCLLGAMSPGPSMVVVINNAIIKGRFHGVLTSIGHGMGIGVYAFFSVLGVALIIKTNLAIFNGIKTLSIFFLIYLGFKSMTNKKVIEFDQKNLKGVITSFFQGLSISLLNPKIFIWFIAIYSQFMSIDNNIIFNIVLILTAGIVDIVWYVTLTFLVTSQMVFKFIRNKEILLQRFVGGLLILIGIMLLIETIK